MFLPDEAWHVDAKGDMEIARGRFMAERLESLDAIVERYCVASSPAKSRLYIGLGSLFVIFAIVGIWVPGWPTVSWAVPAAFLFSYSSETMFRWTLTNRFFGPAMFEYYATGKTIPKHARRMPKAWPTHCQNIAKPYPKHCLNTPKSLPKHAQNMPNRLSKSGLSVARIGFSRNGSRIVRSTS